MLKTSSINSAEPRKSVVGVASGGSNKAEQVGKYEVCSNKSDGCSSNFDKRFHLKLHDDFDVTFQVTH